MGRNWCPECFLEAWHTTHMGCLSSRQNSLSLSPCRLQSTSDPPEALWLFSFRKDSHKFLKDKFSGGLSNEDCLLQTGHSLDFFSLQNFWRQSLQKLWLHKRRTGSLKMSKQTGQVKSSSGRELLDAILFKQKQSLGWKLWVCTLNFHFLFVKNHLSKSHFIVCKVTMAYASRLK